MDEIMTGAAIGGFLSLLETTRQERVNYIVNENPMAYSIPHDVMEEWLEQMDRIHDLSGRIQLLMAVARWGRKWAEEYPR
jgi:hypothetical protein